MAELPPARGMHRFLSAALALAACATRASANVAALGTADRTMAETPSSAEAKRKAHLTADQPEFAPGRSLVSNPDGLAFVLTPEKWDCETKLVNWGRWPTTRKAWCCQHQGKACPPIGPQPYDCGDESNSSQWSKTKQSWCCKVRGTACSDEVYDCEAGYGTFWEGESVHKMQYCCKYSDFPCPEAIGRPPSTTLAPKTTEQRTTSTSPETTAVTTLAATTTPAPSTSTTTRTTAPTTKTTTKATKATTIATTVTKTATTATTTKTTTTKTATTATTVTSTSSRTSTATTTMTRTSTTTLDAVRLTQECSDANKNYLPLDMPGHPLQIVDNVALCQELCRNTTGCAHFSYYTPLRHCHLQASSAIQTLSVGFISGPPDCDEDNENLSEVTMKFSKDRTSVVDSHSQPLFILWGGCCVACFVFAYGLLRRQRRVGARLLLPTYDMGEDGQRPPESRAQSVLGILGLHTQPTFEVLRELDVHG